MSLTSSTLDRYSPTPCLQDMSVHPIDIPPLRESQFPGVPPFLNYLLGPQINPMQPPVLLRFDRYLGASPRKSSLMQFHREQLWRVAMSVPHLLNKAPKRFEPPSKRPKTSSSWQSWGLEWPSYRCDRVEEQPQLSSCPILDPATSLLVKNVEPTPFWWLASIRKDKLWAGIARMQEKHPR